MLKTILKISRHAENHVKHFKECWNIVFKMHYGFQHILKFSFQHALQISEHSEISRHAENHVKHFKECWNIVFIMHYRFQHILKFSFQHALQISEHSEIFKMLLKMFSTHFKHKNSPMVWTMLKTVLRTMSNISKCVENHIENFKAWVVLQKKAWHDHYVTFWKHISQN